jgi:hypothetical protein
MIRKAGSKQLAVGSFVIPLRQLDKVRVKEDIKKRNTLGNPLLAAFCLLPTDLL